MSADFSPADVEVAILGAGAYGASMGSLVCYLVSMLPNLYYVHKYAGLPYDPLSMASLQLWKQENQEDNRPRIERLLRNLPLAMEEELTPRQRQIMRMRYSRNMSVTRIAQELGINKATVSRTLSRSTWKLYRSLRYSL